MARKKTVADFPALAAQWHPTKNGGRTPDQFPPGSNQRVLWKCPKGPDHEWQATINMRTHVSVATGCPCCSGHKVSVTNSLATQFPELAAKWHPTKNRDLTPDRVVAGTARKVWWKCPKGPDHEWEATINSRTRGCGCPFCTGRRPSAAYSLAVLFPQVAARWHPTKNGDLTPDQVTPASPRKIWWKCIEGPDHEWQAAPYHITRERTTAGGCPFCQGLKVSVTNSLATRFPEVAAEWHPAKNRDLTPDRVVAGATEKVWWKCPKGPDNEWKASLVNRTYHGSKCPFCTLTPRSRQEILLAFELALLLDFDIRQHKLKLDESVFDVDILVPDLRLVVEYDGSFWHRDKHDQDCDKTDRLQRNGWRVIRVREQPLDTVGPQDVLVPEGIDPKQCANLVLRRIEEVCGISLPGLPRYMKRKTLLNSKAAEAYIEELLRESAAA